MLQRLITLTLCAGLGSCGGSTDESQTPPSALVTVQTVQQGTVPEVFIAYGSIVPAAGATQTLSEQQPGQVVQLQTTAGARIKRGDALVVFAAAPSAMSGYAQAVSALKSARQQRETTAQLLSEQLATRDQLAQADRAVNDAEVAVDAQRHEGGGETVRTLRAPFDGIVTNVPVAQGERVAADAALLTVAKSDGLIATVGVDPEAAARVQVGETVALERLTDATPLQGRVIRVDGALNPKTRQVDVDVAVPVDAVISGEAVRAAVKVGETKGWVVPHRSVVTDSDQAVIYQVADDKAVSVDVTIASTSTETDVVRGALEATRPIIVDGAFQVQPGMRIRRSQP